MKIFEIIFSNLNLFKGEVGTEEEGIWVQSYSKPKMEFIPIREYKKRQLAKEKTLGQRETGVWTRPPLSKKSWFCPVSDVNRIGSDIFLQGATSYDDPQKDNVDKNTPLEQAVAASTSYSIIEQTDDTPKFSNEDIAKMRAFLAAIDKNKLETDEESI